MSIRRRVFEMMLVLYPADYQARFAEEMRATVATVDAGRCRTCCELTGLLGGLVVEWGAKLTSDAVVRGRHLPDCRKMRPVGVTRAEWVRWL